MKTEAKILILDDDAAILSSAKLLLKQKYTYVQTSSQPSDLAALLAEVDFNILLLDMNFSRGENDGSEGLELIQQSLERHPDLDIIAITAYGEIDLAVEAVRRGARDFITKPWRNEKLLLAIENILALALPQSSEPASLGITETPLIGESRVFRETMKTIEKVSPTDASILIRGENGTGKDLVARAIHKFSNRASKQLVSIDLGAISANLLESELFGHKKGAFTDAIEDKIGKITMADESTLFLDEIGNLSLVQQSKLLTVLQNRIVEPVGSNEKIPVDVRLLSATNADLETMVNEGLFRQDLLYRLNTIEIEVPALRQRAEDIPLLLSHYLSVYKKRYQKSKLKIDKSAVNSLQSYHWPGNVRELAQAVERAVILSDFPTLTLQDFRLLHDEKPEESLNLKEMEKSMILKALEKNKGNITHAAQDLGIDRLALYRRLEKYGL